MTTLALAFSAALLDFVWQGLLAGSLLWVVLLALRKRPAAFRYAASCLALTVLAALPVVTTWLLYDGAAPERAAVVPTPVAVRIAEGAWTVTSSTSLPWFSRLESWALPIWSFGVLLFSVRLAWGAREVHVLRRRAAPAGEAVLSAAAGMARRFRLERPVRVLISSLADGPTVVGWIRPVILLPPATILGLTAQQLEAVLAHEIAHIRRFDYLVNLAQMFVEALLFYHPAVWWVSARIRHERELCCDDLAVAACGDALCYARALSRLERMRITMPDMAMAATGGPLVYRIQRLMGVPSREHRPARLPGIFALCLGLACLALNLHPARGQEQAKTPTPTTRQTTEWQNRDKERGVQVDTAGAPVLRRTAVEYPRAAAAKGVRGSVTVEATLDSEGNVSDARVISGPAELRRAALRSVLDWRFAPDAAGSIRQVTVDFQNPPALEEPETTVGFVTRGSVAELRLRVAERQRALEEARQQAALHPGEDIWRRRLAEREEALADAMRGLQHAMEEGQR